MLLSYIYSILSFGGFTFTTSLHPQFPDSSCVDCSIRKKIKKTQNTESDRVSQKEKKNKRKIISFFSS